MINFDILKNYATLFIVLLTITSNAQVVAGFTVPQTSFCQNSGIISFTNTSTGATTYSWDLGDGDVSSIENPSKLYSTPGQKDIVLIASNGTLSDTARITLTVFRAPIPQFTLLKDTVCAGAPACASSQTILGDAPLLQCFWDFGTQPVLQTCSDTCFIYSAPGKYQVSLLVRDQNGCQGTLVVPGAIVIRPRPTACFTVSAFDSCRSPQTIGVTNCSTGNEPIAFQWTFTRNQTGSTQTTPPARQYTCGIDTIKLNVNDANGCRAEARRVIKINCINAGFTIPTNTPCRNQELPFTNTSTTVPNTPPDSPSYSWLFRPGSTSTALNPSHTYTAVGTFSPRLIVTLNGCRDTLIRTVTVSDSIPIDFTATPTQKCVPPLTVNFTSNAPGAAPNTCSWSFGNNNFSPLCNPTQTYTTSGCFDVSFSASNAGGCKSTVTKKNFVCIQGFDAAIGADSLTGCSPLSVSFFDATQVQSQIVDCQWSFGDGTFSNDCDPQTKTYTNVGTYNVWLRVQTADGCFDTARATVTVTPKPTADFVASPLNACLKQPVSFTCLCSGGTNYLWDFGPGSSTQQNPAHTYDEIGPHTVTLTVRNGNCVSTATKVNYIVSLVPKADFQIVKTCGSPSQVTLISTSQGADSLWWSLGDGSPTVYTDTVIHNYPSIATYKATIYVKNFQTGCIDSLTRNVNFFNPTKNFGASRTSTCIGTTITFTDSTSFGTSWLWRFGDGTTSTLRNPAKSYSATGRYKVVLVIDRGTPCEDSVVKVDYITINKPKAEFTANPRFGCRPLTVDFIDQSTGNFAPVTQWRWQFNAPAVNPSGSLQNPTYIYSGNQSQYNIRLIVTDSAGCRDTLRKDTFIRQVIINPNFTFPSGLCSGKNITFTNTTSSPNNFDFLWNFGDDSTAITRNGVHAYAYNDTFTVSLTATSKSNGCSATVVKRVPVDGIGACFDVSGSFSPCPPFPAVFQNCSKDTAGVKWRWYFGDGRTSEEFSPVHIYYLPGKYTVTLVASRQDGCKDSIVKVDAINILGPRLENISFTPPFGCRPLTVNFSGKMYETQTANLQWTPGDVQNIPINYGDTLYFSFPHIYDNPLDTGFVKPVLVLVDDKGCQVPYPLVDSFYIDEYPYPNQRDTSVCIGATVEYQLTDGDFFKWEPADFLTCDTCMFTVSSAPDTVSYVVTATTIWGCVAKDTVILNVEDTPHLQIGPDIKLCRGETRIVPVGDVYNALWSPNTNISSTTSLAPTVYAVNNTTWVIYSENRLGNRPGCFVYDTLSMTVIDTVKTNLAVDTAICFGQSALLDITVVDASVNDTTFNWMPAEYLDFTNVEDPVATPPFSMPFTVVIKSPLCVSDTATIFVRVDPLPDIELYRDTVVAVGSEVELSALSLDAIAYDWTSVDPLTCLDCVTPTLSAVFSQWIYVTVTNDFGCKAIDSAYIRVLPCTPDFVFVPTVFTPNGDGLNDKLFVRGKALAKLQTFIVSNRWGNIVFSTDNINEGWDGTFRGQLSPTDAYVWYVKGICTNGNEVEKKGTISLIR